MFHCYLKGERVDEVSGASIKHLKQVTKLILLLNFLICCTCYSMYVKSSRDEEKEKTRAELGQVIFYFDDEEEMTDDEDKMPFDEEKRAKDKMWWFAKGLFSSKKKREMFCKLKDPEAKREWIKSEMAKE
ncbi:unnamed protein product [Prunus armeniaca]|nr:unnamed protein product [Prunus armeniaca]